MTIAPWLLFLHVLGAVAWVGGGMTLMAVGMATQRSPDPGAASAFGRLMSWVGPRVLMPGVLLILVTGPWMVLTSAAWDFSQVWVIIGIACFVLAFAVGVGVVARTGVALSRPETPESEAHALLRRWLAAYVVVVAILLIAVWDMVVKPGL
jgi:putative copper export protein